MVGFAEIRTYCLLLAFFVFLYRKVVTSVNTRVDPTGTLGAGRYDFVCRSRGGLGRERMRRVEIARSLSHLGERRTPLDTRDTSLLIEDVGEAPYRIDRMLQQLNSRAN
jgi:hypothetical protein